MEKEILTNHAVMGLCQGRHEIPGVIDYVYPNELNPLDLKGMSNIAKSKLHNLEVLDLYVTGLTVALVEVINVCYLYNIYLTLYHFDRNTGTYYPQAVL